MPFSFRSMYFDNTPVEGRALDIFLPTMQPADIALFFIHGGGWRSGSRSGFHSIMRAFTAKGFICASTDYRLTEVSILEQLADVREGYHLFCKAIKQRQESPRMVAVGSSAGAHLAALLTLASPSQCGERIRGAVADSPSPAALVAQSCPVTFEPWEDIFPDIWNSMQSIVGASYETNPERYRAVSPIHLLSPHSPPIFLLEAENEHMFSRDLTLRFIQKAHTFGCPIRHTTYPRAEHGFFYNLTRPVQRRAFDDILTFIASLDSLRRPDDATKSHRQPGTSRETFYVTATV